MALELALKKHKGSHNRNQIMIICSIIAKNPLSLISVVIIFSIVVFAILSPCIAPYNPLEMRLANKLQPPGATHLFGTDNLGRDVFSRVAYGARISLQLGTIVVGISLFVGGSIGLVAGFWGGWLDNILMRVTDAFLAFPALVLAMAIAASLGPSLYHTMLALSVSWWPWYARLARGQVLTVRETEYVKAAEAIGESKFRIMTHHIAPNCFAPLIVYATLDFGFVLINAAALGFIGLGAQPPTPEWGAMLAKGRGYIQDYWWLPTFPGCALFLTVLGFNLLGDALRDIWDPHLKGRFR